MLFPKPLVETNTTRAFCHQTQNFFESGKGKDLFGEHQERIIKSAKIITNDLKDEIQQVNPESDIEIGNKFMKDWAAENPIHDYYFTRNSGTDLLAKWLGTEKKKMIASVLSTTQEIQDMSSRMTVYAELMPKQMQWMSKLEIQ